MTKGILLISSSYKPDIGGLETHLHDLVKFLYKRGYRVFVLTFKPYQPSSVSVGGFEKEREATIIRLPRPCSSILFAKGYWHPASQVLYIPILLLFGMLFVLLYRKEIDVIHVHGILSTPIACFLSKLARKRCVMSLHHTYAPKGKLHRIVARIILSLPDRVLCLSNKSRLELLKIGLKEEKVQIFTHWIDQELFRPLDKERCKRLLEFEGKFVVLFVGRLVEEKGVRVLLSVAEKLGNTFDDILFVIIGRGPLAREIVSFSKRVKNLRFYESVKDKDLPTWYNAADIVVVPSLYEEGFGRVIAEALSSGTPVIASNKGAIPEILDPSVGILIEPTVENLAKVIIYLYNNRDELAKLAHNCRAYAEERFSENNARVIEEAYFAG